jgi:methionyl aminopeptidase
MIILKNPGEIQKIERACRIVAEVLAEVEAAIRPGVRTRDLDELAEAALTRRGARPAFKGYKGYPATLCTSINDVVVHGIPGEETLKEGDIVSVDLGVVKDGFYGDAAKTYAVGKIDKTSEMLLKTTSQALRLGIEKACPFNNLEDISWSVQEHVEGRGFSVVRDFVGHGIGRDLHEEPPVPNFGAPGRGPKLRAGMVLAIEPMVNVGGPEVRIEKDGWTARTQDGKRSAHFEHCVAVTERGPKVLSLFD